MTLRGRPSLSTAYAKGNAHARNSDLASLRSSPVHVTLCPCFDTHRRRRCAPNRRSPYLGGRPFPTNLNLLPNHPKCERPHTRWRSSNSFSSSPSPCDLRTSCWYFPGDTVQSRRSIAPDEHLESGPQRFVLEHHNRSRRNIAAWMPSLTACTAMIRTFRPSPRIFHLKCPIA